MSQVLTFNEVTLTPVIHNSHPWIRSAELAQALGYSDERSVSKIYQRNSGEFAENMTQVIEILDGVNLTTTTRIFSLRGCHLVAMFSRTPVAKAFRVWVLDVLEKLNQTTQPTLTASTAADRQPLRSLVDAWSKTSNQPHQALWPQVKAHFQLSRIDDLPVEWIPDALAFVQGKIDSLPKALPEPKPAPNILSIRINFLRTRDFKKARDTVRSAADSAWEEGSQFSKTLEKLAKEAVKGFSPNPDECRPSSFFDMFLDNHLGSLKRHGEIIRDATIAFCEQLRALDDFASLLIRAGQGTEYDSIKRTRVIW